MILKDSRPKIVNNSITDNDGIGLYIRDKSHGIIKDNVVINQYLMTLFFIF